MYRVYRDPLRDTLAGRIWRGFKAVCALVCAVLFIVFLLLLIYFGVTGTLS